LSNNWGAVQSYPETGKRHTTTRRGFKTKKEVQIVAAKLEQELASGIPIRNDNLTFHDVFISGFRIILKQLSYAKHKEVY
jgi:hypothetical protein